MRRCRIGAGVLAMLLLLSLAAWWAMEAIHAPVETALEEAARAVLEGDLGHARAQLVQAQRCWDRWQGLRGCLGDHAPMEEVESAFLRLEGFLRMEHREEFVAECMAARGMVADMARAHSPLWWNIL